MSEIYYVCVMPYEEVIYFACKPTWEFQKCIRYEELCGLVGMH